MGAAASQGVSPFWLLSGAARMKRAGADSSLDSPLWGLISGPEATTWSRLLVREHLDRAARLALFQACTDSRDLVLGATARATMKLSLSVEEDQSSTPASMASVQAVKSALLTRGKLPSKLRLTVSTPWLLPWVLGLLDGSTTWLDQLVLDLPPDQRLPTSILAVTAGTCPNLQKLFINAALHALPRPELFPKLKVLCIDVRADSEEQVLRSAGPYIKQLTALTLTNRSTGAKAEPELSPTHLALLFSSANRSTSLRSLKLCATLDDTLLGLLLQCAPTLAHLHVRGMQLTHASHAQATWQELSVSSSLHLSSLARLPHAPGLKLTAPAHVVCDVTTPVAAAAVAAAVTRFREVAFQPGGPARSGLVPLKGMRADDQPVALRAGLGVMRALPSTYACSRLGLAGWTMSPGLILELAGLPAWNVLELGNMRWVAQPQLYTTLLRLLPASYRQVCVRMDQDLTPNHYESICLGAPVGQAPGALFRIRLPRCAPAVVEAVQQKMQQLGVFPNVIVSQL